MGFRDFFGFGLQTRDVIEGPDTPSPASPAQIAPPTRRTISDQPLGLSMVYRAVVIHVISVKQMTLNHWKADVVTPDAADTRMAPSSFVRNPNSAESRSVFLEKTMVGLVTHGNAYWVIQRDAQGRTMNVVCLDRPDQMTVIREDGKLRYYYASRQRPYEADEIKHLKLLRVTGSEYGLGPIQAARVEIDGSLALRDYSSNWFTDSPQPTGVLKSDQVLSPDQAKLAKDSWNASAGGKRGVAVLGQGLSYDAIFLNPADAQFLENRQFDTTQIARLFGVPSSLMLATVEGNSQTYTNVEQDWLGFVRFSNMQYLLEIEEALSELLPRFEYVKFNIESLLRADTTTRYTAHKSGIEAGWLLRSEVRKIENMKPIPGIDDQPKPVAPAAPEGAQNDNVDPA